MEDYIQKIIQVLSVKEVSCCYNDQEQLVYSDFEFPWGDVFSIYGCENETIINYCIYDLTISSQRMAHIFECLDNINNKINYGYFYVDPKTCKIAFGADYNLDNIKTDWDGTKFNEFCLLWYNLFSIHGESLYRVATNDRQI